MFFIWATFCFTWALGILAAFARVNVYIIRDYFKEFYKRPFCMIINKRHLADLGDSVSVL